MLSQLMLSWFMLSAFEFPTELGEHLLTNAVAALKEIYTNYSLVE
jgi:hypothetical protein